MAEITRAFQDAKDQMASAGDDPAVLDSVIYGIEEGDQAIVASRSQFLFESEKSSYTQNETARIVVASKNHATDNTQSYFSLDLAVTYGSTTVPHKNFHGFQGNGLSDKRLELDYIGPFSIKNGAGSPAGGHVLLTDTTANSITSPQLFESVKPGDILCIFQTASAATPGGTYTARIFRTVKSCTGTVVTFYASESAGNINVVGAGEAINFHIYRVKNHSALWGGSVHNLFRSLKIVTRNNGKLEDIQNYSRIHRAVNSAMKKPIAVLLQGRIDGTGCLVRGGTSTATYTSTNWDDMHETFLGHDVSYRFIFNVPISGFVRSAKLYPGYLHEGYRFEWTLNSVADVFHGSDAVSTDAPTGYTITNFGYHASMVELTQLIKNRIADKLDVEQGGGVSLQYPTWATTIHYGQGTNTYSIASTDSLTHALMCMVLFRKNSSDTIAYDSDAVMNPRLVELQWKLGQQNMPNDLLRNDQPDKLIVNIYKNHLLAWDQDDDSSCSWKDFCHYEDNTVADTQKLTDPCKFMLTQSLQTSPGTPGSSSILGLTAELKCNFKPYAATDLPSGRQIYQIVFYHMLLTIKAGGRIEFQT